jgi:erythromycin esterase
MPHQLISSASSACALTLVALTAAAAPAAAQQAGDSAAFVLPALSRLDSTRIDWLRQHAAALRTVDPVDEDYSDLEAIGRAIGDARIVFVGEPSHTTGSLFSAQARLVKYLHRDHDFDVVVFEAGLYDASKVWDAILAGEPPQRAFGLGIPPPWSGPEEMRPLMEYVASRAHTGRPLEVAGYDAQFTGRASFRTLVPDLQAWLDSTGLGGAWLEDTVLWSGFRRIHPFSAFDGDSTGRRARPDSAEIAPFLARLPVLRQSIAPRGADPRARFWLQVLESVDAFARQVALMAADPEGTAWRPYFNLRDAQGGQNLLWLAEDRYRGRKLIVVSATIHAARNLDQVQDEDLRGLYPTGHHVWAALGPLMYTLGLVAFEGESGYDADEKWPIVPDQRPELELEEMLAAAGFEFAFVDYRSIPAGGEWLRAQLVSRPFGNQAALADAWPAVLDGLVFVRRGTVPRWATNAAPH